LPIPGSPACPLKAFSALQRSFPVRPSDPFLSFSLHNHTVSLEEGSQEACGRFIIFTCLHLPCFSLFGRFPGVRVGGPISSHPGARHVDFRCTLVLYRRGCQGSFCCMLLFFSLLISLVWVWGYVIPYLLL
jgi:hypothetical protein